MLLLLLIHCVDKHQAYKYLRKSIYPTIRHITVNEIFIHIFLATTRHNCKVMFHRFFFILSAWLLLLFHYTQFVFVSVDTFEWKVDEFAGANDFRIWS